MPSNGTDWPATLTIKDIHKILPHRYPFLLVDRIEHFDLKQGIIVGKKNVTCNENFFEGHFPGAPIMPGVLIIEALAQTGGVLVQLSGCTDKIAVLLNIKNAKFRRPVKPGDVLQLKCEGLHFSARAGRIRAEASVDGQLVVEAELGFALVDKDQI